MSLLVYGLRFACGMVLTQEEILKCLSPTGERLINIHRRSNDSESHLRIDGMRIRTIEEIRLPFVCELTLSNNELTVLPDLEFMPMLKTLDARGNQIEHLVIKHPSLKYLYISECFIQTADFDTPDLLYLDASQNILKDIQGTFPSLVNLNISYNTFEELIDLEKFPKLKKLEASRNIMEMVDIIQPHVLENLDLRHNIISTVGDLNLPFLSVLYLGYNHITHLPSFTHLHSLRGLRLGNNDIRIIPEFRREFLKTLGLKNTQVRFLAPDLMDISDTPIPAREHAFGVLDIINELPYPIFEEMADEIMV